MSKIVLLSALAMATNGIGIYEIPYDCMDSYTPGITWTNITSTATLGTYNYGGNVNVALGKYCYH